MVQESFHESVGGITAVVIPVEAICQEEADAHFGVIGIAVLDPAGGNAFLLVPLFTGLIPAVIRQIQIGRELDRAYLATEFYRSAVARIEDHWIGYGDTGKQYLGDDEVFADDLDLFGRGSLYQFLWTTRSSVGDDTLASWLTQPADADEIRQRQLAVREMNKDLDLQERLAVLELDENHFQPDALVEWTRTPELFPSRSARVAGFVLAVALAGVILGGFELGSWVTMSVISLELGFYVLFRRRLLQISSHSNRAAATLSFLSTVRDSLRNTSSNHGEIPKTNVRYQ